MRAGVARVFQTLAVAGFTLLWTGSAGAIPFYLQIYADDALGNNVQIANIDQTRMGCVDNPDGVSAVCNATGLEYGSDYSRVSVDITNFQIDSDPVVNGTLGITNGSSTTQHFTFVFTLPVTSMPGGTLTGGRISGTLTDQDANGATVSAPTNSALYTALLDGNNWQSLYADPTSFSVTGTSTGIPQATFGTPIPSLPGPPVSTSIGIKLDFDLTAFDAVSFTSNHVVVPEPSTAVLLGLGLAFFARRRRSA